MAKHKRRGGSRGGMGGVKGIYNMLENAVIGAAVGGAAIGFVAPQYARWGQLGGAYLRGGIPAAGIAFVLQGGLGNIGAAASGSGVAQL